MMRARRHDLGKWLVPLACALLAVGSATAAEITFQASEVDLDQDVNVATNIDGDEWLTFGINMNGTDLLVYGPPNSDPFPPPTDNNGVFETTAGSFEIVFNEVVTDVEIDWFSLQGSPSTFTVFDAQGVATQVVVNPGGVLSDTEAFVGPIKRIVVESDPTTVCIANIRFEDIPSVPFLDPRGFATMALALLMSLAFVVGRRVSPVRS